MQERLLLRELALVLPFGFSVNASRGIHSAYFHAHENTLHDPLVGKSDFIFDRGGRRRTYSNSILRDLCKEYDDEVIKSEDVCVGRKRTNNHLEMYAGRYVLTCHHLPKGRKLPKISNYIENNASVNAMLCQDELFPIDAVVKPSSMRQPFNILLLHTEDEESPWELGTLDFVFPLAGERLASFSIEEVIQEQEYLATLAESDLQELRERHSEFIKNTKFG